MNIDNLKEFYRNRKPFSTSIYSINHIDNIDILNFNYLSSLLIKNSYNENSQELSMVVIRDHGNSDYAFIIFGFGNNENTFSPTSVRIGNVNLSYYFEEYINGKIEVKTDIEANNVSDFCGLNSLDLKLREQKVIAAKRFLNFLKVLNWYYPNFDSIELNKFKNLLVYDSWFHKTKIDFYFKEICSLKWDCKWTTRFKHGEGTLYNFHSCLILPENEYIKYLIKEVIKIEIFHSDVVSLSEEEIEEIRFEHLNKARILAFPKFNLKKYFISLTRDYEKQPFGSIQLDTQDAS